MIDNARYGELLQLVYMALARQGASPATSFLPFDVRDYGASPTASAVVNKAAFEAADAAAVLIGTGAGIVVTGGRYTCGGPLTLRSHVQFFAGGQIDGDPSQPDIVLTMQGGYDAPPTQVFGDNTDVRLRFWTEATIFFEHFGAHVLDNPSTGTNDSTDAIKKTIASLTAASGLTPGLYNSAVLQFLGTYGTSDEIVVNPGGYTIYGAGPASVLNTSGYGFKWVGPVVEGNATKAMLRLIGGQFAKVEGLTMTGPNTTLDKRLYAAIAISSRNALPLDELSRHVEIRRCFTIGDGAGGDNAFQHGITTDGVDGNSDFHIWENDWIAGADSSFTIGHSQNVDIQIRDCLSYEATKCAVWHAHGGELFIDGLYIANLLNGACWFKVGTGEPSEGSPNCRWTFRMVGGEGNIAHGGSFIDTTDGGFATQIFADFTRCEITLPSVDTPVISCADGDTPAYNFKFQNSSIGGTFIESRNSPGRRNVLTFDNCGSLDGVQVQVDAGYQLLEVDVRECWGQGFEPAPPALQAMGRLVNGITYHRILDSRMAGTALSLADASLYAVTSTLADKVGFGNAGFGFESQISNQTFLGTSVAQETLTFTGAFPVRSIVYGCPIATYSVGDYLANSNDAGSRIFVGDASDFRRYGQLEGRNGFTPSVVTPVVFATAAAVDVILTGGWESPGVTYTQAANTITTPPANPVFTLAMVGDKIRFTTGPLAGTEKTITGFTDANTVTVDGGPAAGAGEAVLVIPFIVGVPLNICPIYMQLATNIDVFTVPARLNFSYAEPVTLV